MNKRLPHYRVYARLAVSDIHGVGVRAIRFIKKDRAIFQGDNTEFQWIKKQKIRPFRKGIRKLYEDFAVEHNGWLGCPLSFNRLTPACYLNHSIKPNVAFDKARGFYALRNIMFDEELTVDYRTFSKLYERR